jgi:hypothetical protein
MKSFNAFLTEAAASELKSRYDHFNHLLFHGQLPEVTLKYVPSIPVKSGSQVGGRTTCRFKTVRSGYEVIPGSILVAISTIFQRTQQQQDGILIHEMIHVYFFAQNDVHQDHGPKFQAMAHSLSHVVGFAVPLTDATEELSYSGEIKGLEVGALMLNGTDGNSSLSLFSPGIFDDPHTLAKFVDFFRRHLGEPHYRYEYVFLRGRTVVGRQFKVNRSITKNISVFKITERDKEEVLKTCRVLERLDGRHLSR